MKYVGGDIFVNNSVSCIAELTADVLSVLFMTKIGTKLSFIGSFTLAAIGGLCIQFCDQDGIAIAVFVMIAKFGISFAFNCTYLATPQFFPTEILSTVFGVVNVFARFTTILSPVLAEVKRPAWLPMVIYSGFAVAGAISACFLLKTHIKPTEKTKKK